MTSSVELELNEPQPFADGAEFGETGAYETLRGRAIFRVDPEAPAQATVTDIEYAPRDEDGLVRFSATFEILRPVDPMKANGRLLYDYGNRGNKRVMQFFNDAPSSNRPTNLEHAGNGFLMRRGYTVAWMGWQGDVMPGNDRMLLEVPIAIGPDGPITGTTRAEFFTGDTPRTSFPLSTSISTRSNPTASRDTSKARFTKRRYALSERQEIPSDAWSFSRVEHGMGVDNQGAEMVVIPSDTHIYYPAGFEPGWLYELVYEARDPMVLGLGHVAVRNFVSFLRNSDVDAKNTANPMRSDGRNIEYAYAWGRSQAGRCVRDFIYLGYNADENGQRVFDGMLPHVAGAGKTALNHRFGNIVLLPGQEFENYLNASDRFPFAYKVSTDHLTGATDGIMKRPETDPKVIHTDTAAEYWHRRASMVHTDSRGEDLEIPENVRVYHWASTQHFATPMPISPSRGLAQTYLNTAASSMLFRSTLDNLDAWVSGGDPAPESRVPRRSDGSLATFEEWEKQFPAIQGVALPRGPSRMLLLDFGDQIDNGILLKDPPEIHLDKEYRVQVPAVDADGNDIAGIRVPMVNAPLGTYTGWALRGEMVGNGVLMGVTGSYIPFPNSKDEREQLRDPRPSVAERYDGPEDYVAAIDTAAQALVRERLMLDEDLPRVLDAAADWGSPRHLVRL